FITVERPVSLSDWQTAYIEASIRPRFITVERPPVIQPIETAAAPCFNSATVHHRGETWHISPIARRAVSLQFGHGSSPWRDLAAHRLHDQFRPASIRPRFITVERLAVAGEVRQRVPVAS